MADLQTAFDRMLMLEGGMILHRTPGDSGGTTFGGISRRWHPKWNGWKLIDAGVTESDELTAAVFEFYKQKFWQPISGDQITSQAAANCIFDFCVNTGLRTGIKIMQITVDTTPDGFIGTHTMAKLNAANEVQFVMAFALARIQHYNAIVLRDRSKLKFLPGWINRVNDSLKGLK